MRFYSPPPPPLSPPQLVFTSQACQCYRCRVPCRALTAVVEMQLTNKVAVVTGANRGIGLEVGLGSSWGTCWLPPASSAPRRCCPLQASPPRAPWSQPRHSAAGPPAAGQGQHRDCHRTQAGRCKRAAGAAARHWQPPAPHSAGRCSPRVGRELGCGGQEACAARRCELAWHGWRACKGPGDVLAGPCLRRSPPASQASRPADVRSRACASALESRARQRSVSKPSPVLVHQQSHHSKPCLCPSAMRAAVAGEQRGSDRWLAGAWGSDS